MRICYFEHIILLLFHTAIAEPIWITFNLSKRNTGYFPFQINPVGVEKTEFHVSEDAGK